MITAIIRWSVVNRFFVLLLTAILIGGGLTLYQIYLMYRLLLKHLTLGKRRK